MNPSVNTPPNCSSVRFVSDSINHEILDTLFDEKINGSNHLAAGNSYKECFNGNRSAVHWDMVVIGCDVYCDGVLVRKGRKFVHPSLKGLNG